MNRSLLEKASWIAGIVSAVAALWMIFFPVGQAKQDSSTRQQMATVEMPKLEISTTTTTAVPSYTDQAETSIRDCPSREVIAALRRQVMLMSTHDARDAAYRPLIADAICLNDLGLAAEIAALASTYGRRDEFYQQILDAVLATGKRDTAERMAGLLSAYSLRDAARQKIMASLRSSPHKVDE